MIGQTTRGDLRKTGLVLIGVLLIAVSAATGFAAPAKSMKSSSTQPGAALDPGEWEKVVEAAKKEGKLVICGGTDVAWRKSLVDLFRQDYPQITLEFTGILGRDFWPRLRQEREFGKKLWDLRAGGVEPMALDAKRDGFLTPIRPLLLPEIADDSKWIGGLNGLFIDREKKFVAAYSLYVERPVFVNRDFIRESELKSSGQLLDPKFKGKIVMQNPAGGATFQGLANLAFMYGENFVRDLLTKQDVIVTDDKRQQAEWIVRGRYPIALGFNDTQLIPFVQQGLGKNVTRAEDKIIPAGTGLGGIYLFKDCPHPNAAIVYMNWLLSQKTQIQLSKNVLLNSRRMDVPVIDKETAVDPAHLSNYRFHTTEENVEIGVRFLPVIKDLLKK